MPLLKVLLITPMFVSFMQLYSLGLNLLLLGLFDLFKETQSGEDLHKVVLHFQLSVLLVAAHYS